jgi:hypothetical protein
MNDPGLFVAGVMVTLIVASALGLLVWGAILDGRDEARRRALEQQQLHAVGNVHDRVPPHAA